VKFHDLPRRLSQADQENASVDHEERTPMIDLISISERVGVPRNGRAIAQDHLSINLHGSPGFGRISARDQGWWCLEIPGVFGA
jgi:hypothetical protein